MENYKGQQISNQAENSVADKVSTILEFMKWCSLATWLGLCRYVSTIISRKWLESYASTSHFEGQR